jgi:hypothetical protein
MYGNAHDVLHFVLVSAGSTHVLRGGMRGGVSTSISRLFKLQRLCADAATSTELNRHHCDQQVIVCDFYQQHHCEC